MLLFLVHNLPMRATSDMLVELFRRDKFAAMRILLDGVRSAPCEQELRWFQVGVEDCAVRFREQFSPKHQKMLFGSVTEGRHTQGTTKPE